VENFTVKSETISEGATDVRDEFTNMWLRMITDLKAVSS